MVGYFELAVNNFGIAVEEYQNTVLKDIDVNKYTDSLLAKLSV